MTFGPFFTTRKVNNLYGFVDTSAGIVWSSVISSWPLTNNLVDLKSGFDLVAGGGAALSTAAASKRYPDDIGSVLFNGAGTLSRVNTPAFMRSSTPPSQACLEFSVRPTAATLCLLFYGQRNFAATQGWAVGMLADGSIFLQGTFSPGTSITSPAGAIAQNVWSDVRVSWGLDSGFIYVNGQRVVTGAMTINDANAAAIQFTVGRRVDGVQNDLPYTGYMSHVRFSNVVGSTGTGYPVPGGPFPTS